MRHRRIFHDARQRIISHFAVRQNISLKLLPVAYIKKHLRKQVLFSTKFAFGE
jgi:hypothetical protein